MAIRVLIIGCGSIGERHLRCFLSTGRCEVAACDANPSLLAAMKERYGAPGFASLDAALSESRFDAAVIGTPAPLHLPMARQLLDAGLHLLIEKPLAVDEVLIPEVRTAIAHAGTHVAVAYVYHVMPWIREAREFLRQGTAGAPRHATITGGQHFPSFRPAYREIYYARHDSGGGAIQDALTHLTNAMEWMLGPVTRVFCDASHQVLEGVDVEDTVNISARHGDVPASYAMNQFQAPNEMCFQIHCERGSVAIESHRQRWGVFLHGGKDWTWHITPPLERDELFTAQARAFLDGIEGRPSPLCTFEEAVRTLRFNLAALRSLRTGLPVTLS